MSKHRNYEMIVAKAANMDLVVLCNNYGQWEPSDFKMLTDLDSLPCFLCLPKHKEALLNAMNGGESEVRYLDSSWDDLTSIKIGSWRYDSWYMEEKFESRIKPKKVKCWIAIHGDKIEFVDSRVIYPQHAQFIEIEVEE